MKNANIPATFHCDYAYYTDHLKPYFQQLHSMYRQVNSNLEAIRVFLMEENMRIRKEEFMARMEKEKQLKNDAAEYKATLRGTVESKRFYFLPLKWYYIRQQNKWVDAQLEADLFDCVSESRTRIFNHNSDACVEDVLLDYMSEEQRERWQDKGLMDNYRKFDSDRIKLFQAILDLDRVFGLFPENGLQMDVSVIQVINDFHEEIDKLELMNRYLTRYIDDHQLFEKDDSASSDEMFIAA